MATSKADSEFGGDGKAESDTSSLSESTRAHRKIVQSDPNETDGESA